MNTLGFIRSIVGTPHFMSWSNKNFVISSSVLIGGHITMGDYGQLKTRIILE
jgi:hypothetical protein